MIGSLRVGCSGWQYKDWRGIVYPAELPQRRWFEHYQELFDTVELNSTFYRLPSPSTVEGWAAAARPKSARVASAKKAAAPRKRRRH